MVARITPHDPIRGMRVLALSSTGSLLLLHFYVFCYAAFAGHHLTEALANRLVLHFTRKSPLSNKDLSKLILLIFLAVSMVGARSTPGQTTNRRLVKRSVKVEDGKLSASIAKVETSVNGISG